MVKILGHVSRYPKNIYLAFVNIIYLLFYIVYVKANKSDIHFLIYFELIY